MASIALVEKLTFNLLMT